MITGNTIDIDLSGDTNAAATKWYVQAPFACHLEDVLATSGNSDIGDADTITVRNGKAGTTIGTATFGSDIASGAKATYVAADADQEIAKGGIIEVEVSALATLTDTIHITLILDPYRLQS